MIGGIFRGIFKLFIFKKIFGFIKNRFSGNKNNRGNGQF